MNERTTRGLRPALLLTVGPGAEAIAAQTAALGREWLGLPPPAIAVSLTAQVLAEPQEEALAAACDRLADAGLAAQLQQAGWRLDAGEIAAWLMVEVDQEWISDSSITLAATLAELAWRRLRTHVTLHALLLAEPAAEDAAATWAARLAAAGVTPIGLAGPVSADRLRWDASAWQRQTALGLALLLWSDATPGSGPIEATLGTGDQAPAWGIGTAAWPTPLAEIKRQLLPRCIRLAVARLLNTTGEATEAESTAEAELPPWELPDLAVAPERHRLSLSAAVPSAPPGLAWGRRRPNWPVLATLADELRAAVEAQATRAHDEQFGPRGAWLERQVVAWTTALADLTAERLARRDGWPEPCRLAADLQALTMRLRSASVLIEDWLEAAGQRFSQAEAAIAHADRELEELCRGFPAADRAGLLATLARPWRWPGLVWAYLALLPRAAQQYLDACGRREEARWIEANVHALRQAYLAMAQIVQAQQHEVDALIAGLDAAAEALARERTTLAEPPAPWDARRLDALAQRLVDDGPRPVVGNPPAETGKAPQGLHQVAEEPGTPNKAGGDDGLRDWGAALLAPLEGWTAADWLTQALDDGGLAGWLGDFAGQAAPLWPVTTPEAEMTTWLLWPARRGPTVSAAGTAETRLEAALRAGAAGETVDSRLHGGCCEGDVLALIRLVKVGLEKEPTRPEAKK